jgi:hypothetical protein
MSEHNPYLAAAAEINQEWIACIDHERAAAFNLANCPSNQRVAGIIERHIPPQPTQEG